jgi:hypothetical protein
MHHRRMPPNRRQHQHQHPHQHGCTRTLGASPSTSTSGYIAASAGSKRKQGHELVAAMSGPVRSLVKRRYSILQSRHLCTFQPLSTTTMPCIYQTGFVLF